MGLIIGSLFVNIQPEISQGRQVLAVCTLSTMYLAMMSGNCRFHSRLYN